ncbi:hypothetical protein, partial [Metaplanococcus flavidus]
LSLFLSKKLLPKFNSGKSISRSFFYLNVFAIGRLHENGAASNLTSKSITNADKIENFISSVEQVEVTTPPKEELVKKIQELNNPGNYIFALSDGNYEKNFYIHIFSDGIIHFQSETTNETIYSSKEKHPDILEEFKDTLEISF